MTRWLILSTVVAATALGGCRDRDRNPSNVPPPSAMPVEQTDTTPSTTAPRDTPAPAGTANANANDPWAQPATPSSAGTPSPSAGSADPWAQRPAPSNANPTPGATPPPAPAPASPPPGESRPSRDSTTPTTPNAASPSLPFPPPGTAGKTVGPTRKVQPDEPGTIDQEAPGDAGVNAAAGSGNRDFGHP